MKQKLKQAAQFITNPRLLLCIAIAWFITNGWSYVMMWLGTYFDIHWMTAVAGAYLAFLWLPVSPEKLVTLAIAIGLLRWLFPNDKKTLAILKRGFEKTMAAVKRRKNRKKQEKEE